MSREQQDMQSFADGNDMNYTCRIEALINAR